MADAEGLKITARDGRLLDGLLIRADDPKAGLLISAGTGFPKEYYRRFGELAARRGFTCLLYDCRGIGGSALEKPAEDPTDYPDWGRLDMPAALDALEEHTARLPLLHAGHSVGGHFVGFWDNHAKVRAHAFLCVGSGYWGDHPWWYKPLALWFWHGWGRISLARYGYIERGGGWTGTALPKGVFTRWRDWCHEPGYFTRALGAELKPHHFNDITAKIRFWVYADDPIAHRRTAQTLYDVYPHADREMVVRHPRDFGLKAIGHGGPFTKATLKAADDVLDWLEGQV